MRTRDGRRRARRWRRSSASPMPACRPRRSPTSSRNGSPPRAHPRFNRPYTELIYQPMLEVMRLLRREGFAVWIVTGGGQEFIRAFSGPTYGVPRRPGRRIHHQDRVPPAAGRHAPSCSACPRSMRWTTARASRSASAASSAAARSSPSAIPTATSRCCNTPPRGRGARLGMFVHHDDAAREYAYDRESHIGRLDRGLGLAPPGGWPLISMKNDWRRIFPA